MEIKLAEGMRGVGGMRCHGDEAAALQREGRLMLKNGTSERDVILRPRK